MTTRTHTRSLMLTSTLAGAVLLAIAGCGKPADQAGMPAPNATTMPTPNATALPTPSTPLGAAIDDTALTTKVKTALLGDASIKGLTVSVETIQGDVRLSGFVESQAQIDQALKVAKGVDGVKSVRNELSLKK
jgi:hyperosmotically inducible periplasmic protein